MLLIDEPETALHPAAVRAAKDHLYALAAEAGWQVMLSTHHPAFIDPLKDHTTIVRLHRLEAHSPPNVYRSESMKFEGEEVEKLKALLAFDANVAEIFFGGKILIVEGDTEFAAFHEAMRIDEANYPVAQRPLIVRARGKDAIVILIKMLTHFKIDFSVLHDIDSPKIKTKKGWKNSAAYSANQRITNAIATAKTQGIQVVHRCSCPNFEQHHDMDLPTKDKPYASWKAVCEDATIRGSVLNVLNSLLPPSSQSNDSEKDGANYENLLKAWIKTNDVNDDAFQFD
jgi:predicted ATP-dependent endonuclease of OLD family